MIPSAQLSNTFKSNHMLVTRHLEGLEHSEALLTPSFQANLSDGKHRYLQPNLSNNETHKI